MERLQTSELARSNIQRPFLRFEQIRPSGKQTIEIENLVKNYDDQKVIQNFTSTVMRGEKVVLIGRNGTGKTTMLKSLLAGLPDLEPNFKADGGTVKWGHEAQIGYFPQDHTGMIEHGTTVFEWLYRWDTKKTKEEIRGLLGQMLFQGDEGLKKTESMSGGETARLLFCKLMLQKPNVLILDEPTNHLDLESINALNTSLQKYEGTVLLVTHDRDLIDDVGTRIWRFEQSGKIDDHKGPYSEILEAEGLAAR